MNRPASVYTDDALELLRQYHWPGNVRELKNMVKRLIILRPGERIGKSDIEETFPVALSNSIRPKSFITLNQAARTHIIQALTTTAGMVGGKKGAASLLGLPRSTLQYRMKKLNINPIDFLPHTGQ
jgi:transcriptional regulator of acetoin/glycerol metabolism